MYTGQLSDNETYVHLSIKYLALSGKRDGRKSVCWTIFSRTFSFNSSLAMLDRLSAFELTELSLVTRLETELNGAENPALSIADVILPTRVSNKMT